MTKVNEERVHEIFNNISADYDKMNAIISFNNMIFGGRLR